MLKFLINYKVFPEFDGYEIKIFFHTKKKKRLVIIIHYFQLSILTSIQDGQERPLDLPSVPASMSYAVLNCLDFVYVLISRVN